MIARLLVLLLVTSCARKMKTYHLEDPFFVLVDSIKETWSKDEVDQVLGGPAKKSKNNWVYRDRKRYQNWKINFEDSDVKTIVHIPRNYISLDDVRTKWASHDCQMVHHENSTLPYLACEGGLRRATFDKYGKVTSISISKVKLPHPTF